MLNKMVQASCLSQQYGCHSGSVEIGKKWKGWENTSGTMLM